MDVFEQCKAIATALKVQYVLKGRDLSYEEVFSPTGLMPAIAKRADQLSSLAFGYGIGINIQETKQSMLGKQVSFDQDTPTVLQIICLTDVLVGLMRSVSSNGKLSVDELLTD